MGESLRALRLVPGAWRINFCDLSIQLRVGVGGGGGGEGRGWGGGGWGL